MNRQRKVSTLKLSTVQLRQSQKRNEMKNEIEQKIQEVENLRRRVENDINSFNSKIQIAQGGLSLINDFIDTLNDLKKKAE